MSKINDWRRSVCIIASGGVSVGSMCAAPLCLLRCKGNEYLRMHHFLTNWLSWRFDAVARISFGMASLPLWERGSVSLGKGLFIASREMRSKCVKRYANSLPRGIPITSSSPSPDTPPIKLLYPKIRLLVPSVEELNAPIQRTRGAGDRPCCAKRGAAGGESNRRRVGRGSLALAGNPMHDLSRREALHQASLHVVHIGSDV